MTGEGDRRLQQMAAFLDRLAEFDLPPEAGRILAQARALCGPEAPQRISAPQIDPAVLDHVLSLVGPQDARTLLERLTLDLIQCRDALADGMPKETTDRDGARLRMAAHNLASLSGTAGAEPLRQAALALVAACDRKDGEAVGTGVPEVLHALAGLLDHLDVKLARMTGDRP